MIVARLIAPASSLPPPRTRSTRSPRLPASAKVLGLGRSTRTSSMSRSTGSASASRRSRRRSPASTCGTACWCSTTCRRAMWRVLLRTGAARRPRRQARASSQIVYGWLCGAGRLPGGDLKVFEGDTADPRMLAAQIDKVEKRFALAHVVVVAAPSTRS